MRIHGGYFVFPPFNNTHPWVDQRLLGSQAVVVVHHEQGLDEVLALGRDCGPYGVRERLLGQAGSYLVNERCESPERGAPAKQNIHEHPASLLEGSHTQTVKTVMPVKSVMCRKYLV